MSGEREVSLTILLIVAFFLNLLGLWTGNMTTKLMSRSPNRRKRNRRRRKKNRCRRKKHLL